MTKNSKEKYWQKTLRITGWLLFIWFVVGYVLSILLAPWLNTFTFLGGPFGFWLAQNGAIYVFVGLVFIFCLVMNRLDEEYEGQS